MLCLYENYICLTSTVLCSIRLCCVLIELIPRIAPRSYSIASSSAFLRSPYARHFPLHAPPPPPPARGALWPPSSFPAAPLPLPATAEELRALLCSVPALDAAEAADAAAAGVSTAPGFAAGVAVAEAHLCVSAVEFRTPFKRLKRGLCTSFLASAFAVADGAAEGGCARAWVRVKRGVMGALPQDAEMTALGPGTGVAALLALTQQRLCAVLRRLHTLLAREGLAAEDPEWTDEVFAALAPAALRTLQTADGSGSGSENALVLGASSASWPRLAVALSPAPALATGATLAADTVADTAAQLASLAGLAPLRLLFGCQGAATDHFYRDFFTVAVRFGALERYEACFSRNNGLGSSTASNAAASSTTASSTGTGGNSAVTSQNAAVNTAEAERAGIDAAVAEVAAEERVLRADRYVQHRLTRGAVARAAYSTVASPRGTVVIAGSAKQMPRDVRAALAALVAALAGGTEQDAQARIAEMVTAGRYILECWS